LTLRKAVTGNKIKEFGSYVAETSKLDLDPGQGVKGFGGGVEEPKVKQGYALVTLRWLGGEEETAENT